MFFVGVGTKVAVAFPPLYVLVLTLAWRNERWRRVLGSLFDVGTFFPRAFHPFAPPAYAERAVPELTRRIWRLHDNGGRVVLTAHSQGSVIAAAAVGRMSGRADRRAHRRRGHLRLTAGQAVPVGVPGPVQRRLPGGHLRRTARASDRCCGATSTTRPTTSAAPVRTGTSTDRRRGRPRARRPADAPVRRRPAPPARPEPHRLLVRRAFWTQVDAMCAATCATGAPRPDPRRRRPAGHDRCRTRTCRCGTADAQAGSGGDAAGRRHDVTDLAGQRLVEHRQRELVVQHRVGQALRRTVQGQRRPAPTPRPDAA